MAVGVTVFVWAPIGGGLVDVRAERSFWLLRHRIALIVTAATGCRRRLLVVAAVGGIGERTASFLAPVAIVQLDDLGEGGHLLLLLLEARLLLGG